MNRWLMSTTVLMVFLASMGCARQHAQTLAADLLGFTSTYQAHRAAKAQAETAYYQDQLRILRGALGGSSVVPKDATVATEVAVINTVAYGRITTSATQEAFVLAESLTSPGGEALPGTLLLKYLDQGIRDDLDTYLQAQQRHQQLRADLLATLEKLDLQESRLDTVAKQLKALKEPQTLQVTLDQLSTIGRAIQQQVNPKGDK